MVSCYQKPKRFPESRILHTRPTRKDWPRRNRLFWVTRPIQRLGLRLKCYPLGGSGINQSVSLGGLGIRNGGPREEKIGKNGTAALGRVGRPCLSNFENNNSNSPIRANEACCCSCLPTNERIIPPAILLVSWRKGVSESMVYHCRVVRDPHSHVMAGLESQGWNFSTFFLLRNESFRRGHRIRTCHMAFLPV